MQPNIPAQIQEHIEDFYRSSLKTDCEGILAFRGGSPRKAECELLVRLVIQTRPQTTVDWGLGDGAATIAIVLAREHVGVSGLHVSLDPFQHSISKDVGILQLQTHGLSSKVDFREDRSAEFLIECANNGRRFDFIFVDGDHSMGGKVTDAYLADAVLRPGGVIAFHDSLFNSTATAVAWLVDDRRYEILPLSNEPQWKIAARASRHFRRLGLNYTRKVIPNLGMSIAALRKP